MARLRNSARQQPRFSWALLAYRVRNAVMLLHNIGEVSLLHRPGWCARCPALSCPLSHGDSGRVAAAEDCMQLAIRQLDHVLDSEASCSTVLIHDPFCSLPSGSSWLDPRRNRHSACVVRERRLVLLWQEMYLDGIMSVVTL
jgi:hypothetical protein